MAVQKITGSDNLGQSINKVNNNADEQIVTASYSGGNIILTKFNGSNITVALPIENSGGKILTSIGSITLGSTSGQYNRATITPVTYIYNSVKYDIVGTSIVLFTNGHVSLNRIDAIYVDTVTNTIKRLTGTAATVAQLPTLTSTQLLIGAVYVKPNATSSTPNLYSLIYSVFPAQQVATNISNGIPIVNLEDLHDVQITTPLNGQVLTYNSSTQKWVAMDNDGGTSGSIAYLPLAGGEMGNSAIITGNSGVGIWVNQASLLNSTFQTTLDWESSYLKTGGQLSVDWGNRTLINNNFDITVDWQNKTLNSGIPSNPVLDWANFLMIDSNQNTSVDWNSKEMYDSNGSGSIDWNGRGLYNSSGQILIDYENGHLWNDTGDFVGRWRTSQLIQGGATSVHWGNRVLADSTNSTIIDWENKILGNDSSIVVDWSDGHLKLNYTPTDPTDVVDKQYVDGIASSSGDGIYLPLSGGVMEGAINMNSNDIFTGDYSVRTSNATLINDSVVSLDWNNRTLSDSASYTILDWQNKYLYEGTTLSLDWSGRNLNDSLGVGSLSWSTRRAYNGDGITTLNWNLEALYANDGSQSIDWSNRTFLDSVGNTVGNWNSKTLSDSSANASVEWDNRFLRCIDNSVAIDWENRNLTDSDNHIVVDWAGKIMYSSYGIPSVDWSNGALYGSAGVSSLDFRNKKLYNDINDEVANYNGSSFQIIKTPIDNLDAVNKLYVDSLFSGTSGASGNYLPLSGGTMGLGANITINNGYIIDNDSGYKIDLTILAFVNEFGNSVVNGNDLRLKLNNNETSIDWGNRKLIYFNGSIDKNILDWSNGNTVLTQDTKSSGVPTALLLTGAPHTNTTAATEVIDVNFNLARTVQHATGAIANQRAFQVQAPTYSFVGASTITNCATFYINAAPTAGVNATLTNNYALWAGGTTRIDGDIRTVKGSATNIGTFDNQNLNIQTNQVTKIGITATGIQTHFQSSTASTGVFISQTQANHTGGTQTGFLWTAGSLTGQTASAEIIDINYNLARTIQHATGAITTQRSFVIQARTHTAVGASVITTASTLAVSAAPVASTNITITNPLAFWVQAGDSAFGGGVNIGSSVIPSSSTILRLISSGNNKGFGNVVMTTAQKLAIGSPIAGLQVVTSDVTKSNDLYDGSRWKTAYRSLFNSVTQTNNGGAETDAYSYTMPANTMSLDLDSITFEAEYTANPGTTKQIRVYFNGSIVGDSGSISLVAGGTATSVMKMKRVSSTSVRITVTIEVVSTAGVITTTKTNTTVTSLNLVTTGYIIKNTVTGATPSELKTEMGDIRIDYAI